MLYQGSIHYPVGKLVVKKLGKLCGGERVEIKIFYLARCMTVPMNFNRGAARSGIRQIGNVIIFHLWSSFMESQSHSWIKVIKQHFVGCF